MSKGHDRERQLKQRLENDGWWVARAAGSLGDADLVALRFALRFGNPKVRVEPFARALMVELKSNKLGGPYMNFRAEDRKQLSEVARLAGAEAWLVYWPPRKEPQWIPESEWPKAREEIASASGGTWGAEG